MNVLHRLLLATCLTFASASTAFASAGALPAPATAAQLRTAIAATMVDKQIPGASYAVFDRDGVTLSGSVGVVSARTREPVTPATLFRIASISKSVTAIAIMQLVERGHFTLETPVVSLLPGAPISNAWEASEPVRVVHLLSHTAGFDDTHPKAFFGAVERRGGHLAALVLHPEPLKARWRPGSVHSYSNPGYWVLGAILEQHYGKPWDEIVRRQVLDRLGMNDTVALVSQALTRPHASGHAAAMRDTGTPFGVAQADGALWCSAPDLARLGRFLLTDGAAAPGVLTAASVRTMKRHQQTLAARAGLDYGYGLALQPRTIDGVRWLGHTGADAGALASMQFHEAAGRGYVLLVNSENALRPVERQIAAFVLAKSVVKPQQPITAPASVDVNGWYRATHARSGLVEIMQFVAGRSYISARGSQLVATALIPGLTMSATLNHHGAGLLSEDGEGGVVNGVVVRDSAGQMVGIQVGEHYMQRTSALAAAAPTYGVALSLLMLLSAPFGRRKRLHNLWVRRLPALYLGVLGATVYCLVSLRPEIAGMLNWQTAGILAGTTLLPLLAAAAVIVNVRAWRGETAQVAKWRAMAGALGAAFVSIVLALNGWLAMTLWAW